VWYQLKIEGCAHDKLEEVSEILEDEGCLSIMLTDKNDDPVLEPALGTTPLWPEVIINALFDAADIAEHAKEVLTKYDSNLQFELETVEDKDWERAWMDDFKPQRFGQRLWICPSWHQPPEPDAVNLKLDPGLAFGTGTHPTTSLCLSWLDQADLQGKTLIDYGCGSGILALAAIKLGAARAYAVDIDPQALQATKNNALENTVTDQQLTITSPDHLNKRCDILIANILLAPLLSLKANFHQLLKPKGELVVSGLLENQVEELITSYQGYFNHQTTNIMDDWALVTFIPVI